MIPNKHFLATKFKTPVQDRSQGASPRAVENPWLPWVPFLYVTSFFRASPSTFKHSRKPHWMHRCLCLIGKEKAQRSLPLWNLHVLPDPKNCLESSLCCSKSVPFSFSSDFPQFRQAEKITLGLGYTPLTPAMLQRSLTSPSMHRTRGKITSAAW